MTWSKGERLYDLLPAHYRARDSEHGETLRALLSIFETQLETIEADIEGLYENWFIETSDEWVVPYIADLLGARLLHTIDDAKIFSQRAYVANLLAYRRRKGTATVLEQLTRDVTGWPARAVEFFQRLSGSQHLNHVRPQNLRTPDLRRTDLLDLVGTPFEQVNSLPEVRRIEPGRGLYNIPNIGLFVWRLGSYAVERSRAGAGPGDGLFYCSPLAIDGPLFNRARSEDEIAHLAEEINVPGPLRRRALHDDLEELRQTLVDGEPSTPRYFAQPPVVRLFVDEGFDAGGDPIPMASERILICDLSTWERPPGERTYLRRFTNPDGTPGEENVSMPIEAAIDPLLGRIAFPAGEEPTSLHVSYAYGFPSDIGGGPYERREGITDFLEAGVDWQVGVSRSPAVSPVGAETIFADLTSAVGEWNSQPPGTRGLIAIMDSDSYVENLSGADSIQIPAGSHLLIVAGDWPTRLIPDSLGQEERIRGTLIANRLRPHLQSNISVRGTAPGEGADAGSLTLDGLLIEGGLQVLVGNLGDLVLRHTTLLPGGGGLRVNQSNQPGAQNDRLHLSLLQSILGRVELPVDVPRVTVRQSGLLAPGQVVLDSPGATADIEGSTLMGGVHLRSVEASDSIFFEPVVTQRRQEGCIRFSYVAPDSRTPRRYRCQPDLALDGVTDEAERASIRLRVAPAFTSDEIGDPAFLQLSRFCPVEISEGGEDGSEMGLYYHLKEALRHANLVAVLDEYLPFGLEAGIFPIT